MRSDWDADAVARKGKNQHGEERLAQFTYEELRAINLALDFFIYYDTRFAEPADLSAKTKVEARLAAMEARRGGRT